MPEPETDHLMLNAYLTDIRNAKDQQLRITHYSLLLQAAICTGFTKLHINFWSWFLVAPIIVAASALAMICSYFKDILAYRKEKKSILLRLGYSEEEELRRCRKWIEERRFSLIYSLIVIAGAVAALIYMYYIDP